MERYSHMERKGRQARGYNGEGEGGARREKDQELLRGNWADKRMPWRVA